MNLQMKNEMQKLRTTMSDNWYEWYGYQQPALSSVPEQAKEKEIDNGS